VRPYQGKYHDPDKDSPLNAWPTNGEHMCQYSKRYNIGSRRFGPEVGTFMCIPVFQTYRNGGIHFTRLQPKTKQDLVDFFPNASPGELDEYFKGMYTCYASRARTDMADFLNSLENETFSGTQGLTVPLMVIVIDSIAIGVVGLDILCNIFTRSPRVIVVINYLLNGQTNTQIEIHPFFKELAYYERQCTAPHMILRPDPDHLVDFRRLQGLPPSDVEMVLAGDPATCLNWDAVKHRLDYVNPDNWYDPFAKDPRGGYRNLQSEDPMYMTRAGLPDEEKIADPIVERPPMLEKKLKTHLPPENTEGLLEQYVSETREKMDRELYIGGYSNQAPDEFLWRKDADEIRRKEITSKMTEGMNRREANSYLNSLKDDANKMKFVPKYWNFGQDQRASDPVSFAAGMGQRIRRCSKQENIEDHHSAIAYGDQMFKCLKDYLGWISAIPWDELLFQECVAIFSDRRMDRSEALKNASLPRADPDYLDRLTAKTQWKLKDLIPALAKPLQTILVRSDEYIFKHGPIGVYLLEQLMRHTPDYLYIHVKKSFGDLADWCLRYGTTSSGYTDLDISALDSSERGGALQLEIRYLEHFSVPKEMIIDYTEDKYDFHTASIHFGLMRFSGEIYTFLFNTIFMLARTVTKYIIVRGRPVKVAGDDVLVYGHLEIRIDWADWELYDHCEEKKNHRDYGAFCSFVEKKGKIFKDPRILLKRWFGAIEAGRVKDVIAGYYLDFLTIYEHGDNLYELHDDTMLQAQAILARELFNAHRNHGVHINYKKLEVGHREVSAPEFASLVSLFTMVFESMGEGYTPQEVTPDNQEEELSWAIL